MKLLDGIKLKGAPAEIPNVSRDDLPQFFTEMGYKIGAEIGVYKGKFSEKICKAGLSLISIDPWLVSNNYEDARGQKFYDSLYQQTKDRLKKYPNSKIIKKTSMEAVAEFPDEHFDFVYIDGNHEFAYVAEDLFEWTKKIKKGGTVAGHDFVIFKRPKNGLGANACHVPYVLEAFTECMGIENWYLLGRRKALPGEKRDRWRSWMFIKPY